MVYNIKSFHFLSWNYPTHVTWIVKLLCMFIRGGWTTFIESPNDCNIFRVSTFFEVASRNSLSLCIYSGNRPMQTPLGPTQSVLIRGVSIFQGLFNRRKIHLGPHALQCLHYSGCPHFKGARKAGLHCIPIITLKVPSKLFLSNGIVLPSPEGK